MDLLKDKLALITGGGGGLGSAMARGFARQGARVIVADIDPARAQAIADEVRGAGGTAWAESIDVTDRAAVADLADSLTQRLGPIDVLVNNAGIVQDAQLTKMTDEQFDLVIDINLRGVYNCAKAVVDTMVAQGGGVILNASSVVGVYGNFGQTNYAATKFGVIGFVKTWAKELGKKGIRANAVCPGFVATPILKAMPEKVIQAMEDRVPMKRMAQPEEIANLYAFLASDEASYINGAAIEITGGLTL